MCKVFRLFKINLNNMFPRYNQFPFRSHGSFPVNVSDDIEVKTSSSRPVIKVSMNIPVDQFFSQPHNLRNGRLDTSPLAAGSVAAASHISPVGAERPWPSDTPDDVILGSVVPRSCQTLYETSELARLRPQKTDYVEASDPDTPAPDSGHAES